jgi:hypothetical protein
VVYAASKGITALKPKTNGEAPEQIWRSEQLNPSTISPVVVEDHIFTINSAGVLNEANRLTGDRGWKLRLTGPFSGSPVAAGKNIVAVSEKGVFQVVDTTAAEGAVIATLQLPLNAETKELVLSTPALSGKHVFVRTDSTLWRIGE